MLNNDLDNLPTATKEGYIFKYWSLSGDPFKLGTKIDKDITLVAVYDKVEEPVESVEETNEETQE